MHLNVDAAATDETNFNRHFEEVLRQRKRNQLYDSPRDLLLVLSTFFYKHLLSKVRLDFDTDLLCD